MPLKPRTTTRVAAPTADETKETAITSRERVAPVANDEDEAEDIYETAARKMEQDRVAAKAAAAAEADNGKPDDDDGADEAGDKAPPEADAAPRTQRRRTPPPAGTTDAPATDPKARLSEIRRELKALNSEELAARKALDAEFGAKRKALRSEYDLLTRAETAVLFGDEPDA